MAVKLRLRRMGKKKQPIYKVVAADSRSPRDGKFLEAIGLYNPLTNPSTIDIKEDRAMYWLNVGAQPTNTVKSLLSKKGILLKRDLQKRGLPEEKIREELEKWEKLNEGKTKSAVSKKKAVAQPIEEIADTPAVEEVSKEKASEEIDNKDVSTAEVKGAASDEKPAETE